MDNAVLPELHFINRWLAKKNQNMLTGGTVLALSGETDDGFGNVIRIDKGFLVEASGRTLNRSACFTIPIVGMSSKIFCIV